MTLHDTRGISAFPLRAAAHPSAGMWVIAASLVFSGIVGGCASDDVGHSTTTTTKTTETPTERATVTGHTRKTPR